MILLMGITSESPLRLLAEACTQKRYPFVLFNQRHQQNWRLNFDVWHPADTCLYNGQDNRCFRLDDCTGLYLRPMDHTKVPEYADGEDKKKIDELYSTLFGVLDSETQCRVVNPPTVQLSNNSKPYQTIFIKNCGLDIPDSCITNDEEEAAAFISGYPSVIYKSISGTRSIVKQVTEDDLTRLYKLKYCPVQFQEWISGFNLRVHVVGQQTWATKICSDAVDYRYARTEGKTLELEPYQLPDDLAEKCVRLAHSLRLPFAGLDLMLTKDGRSVCFEVNPSPGYSFYEQATGQRISHSLADYLAGCLDG